jgi:hypothetical protein
MMTPLLEELLRRPSPREWRDAVAAALDDPPVRIAFWDPAAERYRAADGSDLAPPRPGSGRSTVEARHNGQPVAALDIDEALAEDPELVRAASTATVLAVENGNLEGRSAHRKHAFATSAPASANASSATCTTAPSSA